MFQLEVEKLLYSFSSQTGAFIVTSWWEVIACVPSNPGAKLLASSWVWLCGKRQLGRIAGFSYEWLFDLNAIDGVMR